MTPSWPRPTSWTQPERPGPSSGSGPRWSGCSATAVGLLASIWPTAAPSLAPIVVNAAGPWSSGVNRLAGVTEECNITSRALRQDVVSTEAPAGFGVADGGAVVADLDLGTYNRPQPGGSYLGGGVEADCDPLTWIDDPDGDRPTPDPEVWEAIMLRLARRLPEIAVPHRPTGLASHYDVTDDWIPIYDRTSLDGFYLAIGTSGNQFKERAHRRRDPPSPDRGR